MGLCLVGGVMSRFAVLGLPHSNPCHSKTLTCSSPSGLQGELSGLANVAGWQPIGGTL